MGAALSAWVLLPAASQRLRPTYWKALLCLILWPSWLLARLPDSALATWWEAPQIL